MGGESGNEGRVNPYSDLTGPAVTCLHEGSSELVRALARVQAATPRYVGSSAQALVRCAWDHVGSRDTVVRGALAHIDL
jgi:hypothetical protein